MNLALKFKNARFVSENVIECTTEDYSWSAIDFGVCVLISGHNRKEGIMFGSKQFQCKDEACKFIYGIIQPNLAECLMSVLKDATCSSIDLDGLIEVISCEDRYSIVIEENVITKLLVVGSSPIYQDLNFSEILKKIGV